MVYRGLGFTIGHLRETGINAAFGVIATTPPILCIGRKRETKVVRERRRLRGREGVEEKGSG